jgi:hypothetical protein
MHTHTHTHTHTHLALIALPLAEILTAVGVHGLTLALAVALVPLPAVLFAVWVRQNAFSVPQVVDPVSLINGTVMSKVVKVYTGNYYLHRTLLFT